MDELINGEFGGILVRRRKEHNIWSLSSCSTNNTNLAKYIYIILGPGSRQVLWFEFGTKSKAAKAKSNKRTTSN